MPRVLLQRFRDGQIELAEAPVPRVHPSGILVESLASVVSAGTERMLIDFGRDSLLGKARKQPERVAEVVQKASTDGIAATVAAVQSKLDEPTQFGYANAGIVREVGPGATGFRVGDLVATNGPHAEWVSVPGTLAAHVPSGVEPEKAAFATLGGVALEGVRLAQPELGEHFAVIGLGLIGLLTTQLLLASGCPVLAIDPSADRRQLARDAGARTARPGEEALQLAQQLTNGLGLDGVLVCASTSSSDPVHEAAEMARIRGRLVLVGVTGMELQRSDFYEKELTFQVSASFGPGKYDPSYAERGHDYPFGYARWTAGRNMSAILGALESGRLDVSNLITHRFAFDEAADAYDSLLADPNTLGVVLDYGAPTPDTAPTALAAFRAFPPTRSADVRSRKPQTGRLAVIGAGNYATRTLLPALVAADAELELVVSSGGTSAAMAARGFGARRAGTDVDAVFDDQHIDTVVIATRHDSHASYVERALRAGKNVLVEKPLAITLEQLDGINSVLAELQATGEPLPLLMVGFNRRFAPITAQMQDILRRTTSPRAMALTMNAGAIPSSHWTQDATIGGGRIVGEACHLIDLARFLAGTPIVAMNVVSLDTPTRDSASLQIRFEDSSFATVNYLANGSLRYDKERVETFSASKVLVNENYRRLRVAPSWGFGLPRPLHQNKGHQAMVNAFLTAVRTGSKAPIDLEDILEVAHWSIIAQQDVG